MPRSNAIAPLSIRDTRFIQTIKRGEWGRVTVQRVSERKQGALYEDQLTESPHVLRRRHSEVAGSSSGPGCCTKLSGAWTSRTLFERMEAGRKRDEPVQQSDESRAYEATMEANRVFLEAI